MREIMRTMRTWSADEDGGSLVEYLMLASLVAVVCVAAVTLLGRTVRKNLAAPAVVLTSA